MKLSALIAGLVITLIGGLLIAGGGLLETAGGPGAFKIAERTFQDPTPGACSRGLSAATLFGGPEGGANSPRVITSITVATEGTIQGIHIRAWLSGSTHIGGQPMEDPVTGCPGDSRSTRITWNAHYVCPPPSFGAICDAGFGETTEYLDKYHRWIYIPGGSPYGVVLEPGDWLSFEIVAWGLPPYYYAWLSAEDIHPYPYESDVAMIVWGETPPEDVTPPDRDPCPQGQHWDDLQQKCIEDYTGGGGDQGPEGEPPITGSVVCPPGTEYDSEKADPWTPSELQNMTDQQLKDYGVCAPPPKDILGILLLGVAAMLIIIGLILLLVGIVA